MTGKFGIFALFSAIIVVLSSGCGGKQYDQNPYNQVKAFLEAPHNLRKMMESKDSRASSRGEFFLFSGSISGNSQVIHSVKFAWDLGDNVYPIVSVPLEKVRIRPIQKVEVPTVAFFLDDREINRRFNYLVQDPLAGYDYGRRAVENSELRLFSNRDDLPRFLNEHQGYLKYVVITCSEFDWPQNISLPLNNPEQPR
ncbi:MAG: hypothetical protein HYT62_03275 [Candidatus Yanofskybacteria bacterium]|nr:hypothetical protein [Candidatus Yanofskybacteria bacterium]